MTFTLIILFLLFIGLYSGFRRGIILQLILTIGFVLSFWVALLYFETLSEFVELVAPYPTPQSTTDNPFFFYEMDLLFELDGPFYNGLSFLIILFFGWLGTRFIGGLFHFLMDMQILEMVSRIGGAIISFGVHYVGIFLVLFLLTTVPIEFIQNQFENSSFAQFIVEDTPELSNELHDWWIERGLE